jgi:hypothetical protein
MKRAHDPSQPAQIESLPEVAARERPKGSRKNLVVVRAGRTSLHPGWTIGTGEAEFDLLVAAYEPCTCGASDEWLVMVPGRKIAGYYELFLRHPELFDLYEYIALIDDDIETTKEDINRLFQIGRTYRLDVFQPALSWDSYFSYAATLVSKKFRLRFTNTVEMMCPVFSSKYLKVALPLFGLGFETGIDLLWTRLSDDPWFRYAIVDDVVVKHTRVVGTTKNRQGFAPGEAYDGQAQRVLNRFGVEFRGFVTYAAIDKSNRPIRSRYLVGLHSGATWRAWRNTPMPFWYFLRLASDYTRHCFLRPTNLCRISLDGDSLVSTAAGAKSGA